jgi:uncharacterized protein
MKNVLIAGGTGLLGSRLSEILMEKGYKVSILTRKPGKTDNPNYTYYIWDPAKREITDEAIQKADYIVNLAGANIGGNRWTESYKKLLLSSRIESTNTIVTKLKTIDHNVKTLYNASASGYYGYNRGEEILGEESGAGTDFLSDVCMAWENEAKKLNHQKTRLVIFRQGLVFSSKGGAMAAIATPIKLFAGATFGSGNQFMPWIHIDDLCHAIIYSFENEKVGGIYNAVSPEFITNEALVKSLAKEIHRPVFLPSIPESVLKIMVGDAAESLVGSLKLSAGKIISTGFTFEFPELSDAIHDLYKRKI